jgi:hypothetical protein
MSELFDELARSLTRPMPRRRVLRLLGGALVAAAVPGGLRSRPALGAIRGRAGGLGLCEKDCSAPFPVPCICPGPDPKYCFETCGEAGSTCCCLKGTDGRPSGAVACPPGTRCGRPGESNCVCVKTCGTACCGKGEFCANPRENLCCKEGERGCGLQCCKANQECVTVRVGTGRSGICTQRCPSGRAWCGKDTCCPPRWRCVNESTGLCKRCGRNEEECGKKCCDRATSRCCGPNLCCKKGRACCTVDGKRICCPPNTKCAPMILPGAAGITKGSPRTCCPLPRFSKAEEICCPPGQVALNTPGFALPPTGISAFCCPPAQICPSSTLGKACVDLQSDPRNCGSCGNVCPSGICSRGVCASP